MRQSQFSRIEAYTETRMAESFRQAYDYWQDQPGLCTSSRAVRSIKATPRWHWLPCERGHELGAVAADKGITIKMWVRSAVPWAALSSRPSVHLDARS